MRLKGGQGGIPLSHKARWVPNHKWAHLSPILAPNPKVAKRTSGPQIDHNQPMASGNHQRPPAQFQKGFPSIKGNNFPSFMDPVPKDPGMVHIWYNIPLCAIFSQKSNSDAFRTQICHFNSSPQIHHPFQRKTFQSFSLAIPDSYKKTIQGPQPPGSTGVGLLFHSRIIQSVISRGYQSFNQMSRHQALQYSLDNSIGPYRLYSSNLYGLCPFEPINIPLWYFSHTVQFSRRTDLY
ncbi:hypothetical protein O181_000538 [Austropuccinia psidii MF-1]|uniref:Uncharacterized protein n=1 Tax=Austropuccinia psidii MF-1 TaxID=1389203 RepID=A0A9Q3GAY7_9BASI|nr:hypothetical protein [Austropuccinia psidii MF-1]